MAAYGSYVAHSPSLRAALLDADPEVDALSHSPESVTPSSSFLAMPPGSLGSTFGQAPPPRRVPVARSYRSAPTYLPPRALPTLPALSASPSASGGGGGGAGRSDSVLGQSASSSLILVTPFSDAQFQASWPQAPEHYKLYASRCCMLALAQSLVWITFSPITKATERYFHTTETQVDLLLNWGTIMYVAAAPFAVHWGTTPRGLRQLMLASAWLIAFAVCLRLVPIAVNREWMRDGYALWFLHAAHILNAMACPPISVTVTKLSSVWMGERERTTTTAIAVVANSVGTALGMVLGPYIVSEPEHMPRLLWAHAGFGVLTLLLALAYLPAMPPSHPSPAAADMFRRPPAPFLPSLRVAFGNGNFLLLALCTGLSSGIFNVFCGVLSTILDESYSARTVGWFSSAATFANIAGGVVMACVAQRGIGSHRTKRWISILLWAALACAGWFMLSVPSIFSDRAVLPSSQYSLGISITLLGLCVGAVMPLAFELSVEMCYPLSESVSAGLISMFSNGVGIIFLFVAPVLHGKGMNGILLLVALVSALGVPFVRESYRRQAHEATVKIMAAEAGNTPGGGQRGWDLSPVVSVNVSAALNAPQGNEHDEPAASSYSIDRGSLRYESAFR